MFSYKTLTVLVALTLSTSLSFANEIQDKYDVILKNPMKSFSLSVKDEANQKILNIPELTNEDKLISGNMFVFDKPLTKLNAKKIESFTDLKINSLDTSCSTTAVKFTLNDYNQYFLNKEDTSFFCDEPIFHKSSNINNELTYDYYATITSKTKNFIVGDNQFTINIIKDTKAINTNEIKSYLVPFNGSNVIELISKSRKNGLGNEFVGKVNIPSEGKYRLFVQFTDKNENKSLTMDVQVLSKP